MNALAFTVQCDCCQELMPAADAAVFGSGPRAHALCDECLDFIRPRLRRLLLERRDEVRALLAKYADNPGAGRALRHLGEAERGANS